MVFPVAEVLEATLYTFQKNLCICGIKAISIQQSAIRTPTLFVCHSAGISAQSLQTLTPSVSISKSAQYNIHVPKKSVHLWYFRWLRYSKPHYTRSRKIRASVVKKQSANSGQPSGCAKSPDFDPIRVHFKISTIQHTELQYTRFKKIRASVVKKQSANSYQTPTPSEKLRKRHKKKGLENLQTLFTKHFKPLLLHL